MFLALAAMSSCRPQKGEISFDTSDPNALLPNVDWCVITEPYVAFHEDANWDSATTGHCRKGDIFQIQGKRIAAGDVWYKLDDGWVNQAALSIYANKYMAQTAAGNL